MLYVAELTEYKSISAVAEKNAIKASNLSKLINEAEKEFGVDLFLRTNKGVIAKKPALEIALKAGELKKILKETENLLFSNKKILIYVDDDLEFHHLEQIGKNVTLCNNKNKADIIIGLHKPKDAKGKLIVNIKNGDLIVQNLFICAKDTPEIASVVTSIILMFQHK